MNAMVCDKCGAMLHILNRKCDCGGIMKVSETLLLRQRLNEWPDGTELNNEESNAVYRFVTYIEGLKDK